MFEAESKIFLQNTQFSSPHKDKTDKKRLTDRFVCSRRQSDRKRSLIYREQNAKSLSPDHSQHYSSFISRSMYDEDELISLRSFTLNKLSSQKNRVSKLKGYKTIRKNDLSPHRNYSIMGWKDNYYTNLLDWSYNDFVCAGFLNKLSLYNMQIDDEFQSSLCRIYSIGLNGQILTSLKSSPYETKIALGFSNGALKIYDYFKQKHIYNGYHHLLRIATISWQQNLIITGSKDQYLKMFDTRQRKIYETKCPFERSHSQQICGIKQKGNYIASGGNDNKVFIYDIRKLEVLDSYSHNAAVKGVAWIGDRQLVTGGGTADKKIKFWRDTKGVEKQIDTGSQVCNLAYSSNTQQIASCQGFSLNQIILWSKNGERQYTFHGHSSRVLYSALSPTGQYLASGAGDQSLKIWRLFPPKIQKTSLLDKQLR